jgi:hypothetical protein
MELIPAGVQRFSLHIQIKLTVYSSIRYYYPEEMQETYNYFKNNAAIDMRFPNSRYHLHTDTASDGLEYPAGSEGCIRIPEIRYEFCKALISDIVVNDDHDTR